MRSYSHDQNSKSLLCFDMDGTLTETSSMRLLRHYDVMGALRNTIMRKPWEMATSILHGIKTGHVAITTFCTSKEYVKGVLRMLLGEANARKVHIITATRTGLRPEHKVKMVQDAMQHFGVNDKRKTWLIDDSYPNCEAAHREGINTHHVGPRMQLQIR